jgi:hypothetical protein
MSGFDESDQNHRREFKTDPTVEEVFDGLSHFNILTEVERKYLMTQESLGDPGGWVQKLEDIYAAFKSIPITNASYIKAEVL